MSFTVLSQFFYRSLSVLDGDSIALSLTIPNTDSYFTTRNERWFAPGLKRSYASKWIGERRGDRKANALTRKRGPRHMEFVGRPASSLLDCAGTMKGHMFLAGDLCAFSNRAFGCHRYEVNSSAPFSLTRVLALQDNHRPVGAVPSENPPISLSSYRTSVPMITTVLIMDRRDFIEKFHCVANHANTCDTSSFLSAINPSSETKGQT